MRLIPILAATAALSLTAAAAQAEVLNFSADLKGANEVPANTTGGTGHLNATFDTGSKMLMYGVTCQGLTGAATMAHFHGPAAAGANAPPVVVVPNPACPIDGMATLTDAQAADLMAGKWYFNIHTGANPGGEIRGQVGPATTAH